MPTRQQKIDKKVIHVLGYVTMKNEEKLTREAASKILQQNPPLHPCL